MMPMTGPAIKPMNRDDEYARLALLSSMDGRCAGYGACSLIHINEEACEDAHISINSSFNSQEELMP